MNLIVRYDANEACGLHTDFASTAELFDLHSFSASFSTVNHFQHSLFLKLFLWCLAAPLV